MAKLTLDMNKTVLARARRYATRHGTSVSALVEHFLTLVSGPADRRDEGLPPTLARLRRELQGATVEPSAYWEYIEAKYR